MGVTFPNQTGFGLEKDTEWNVAALLGGGVDPTGSGQDGPSDAWKGKNIPLYIMKSIIYKFALLSVVVILTWLLLFFAIIA